MRIVFLTILNISYIPASFSKDLAVGESLGSYSWEAIKVILSLAIVLIIFYLLVNAFRKYTGISVKTNSSIRILGGLSLGGKEKVVILEAGKVNFLLGVSSAGVNKIHQFEEGEFSSSDEGAVEFLSFNQQIDKLLGKKKS